VGEVRTYLKWFAEAQTAKFAYKFTFKQFVTTFAAGCRIFWMEE
jgi:hypothetical protein